MGIMQFMYLQGMNTKMNKFSDVPLLSWRRTNVPENIAFEQSKYKVWKLITKGAP